MFCCLIHQPVNKRTSTWLSFFFFFFNKVRNLILYCIIIWLKVIEDGVNWVWNHVHKKYTVATIELPLHLRYERACITSFSAHWSWSARRGSNPHVAVSNNCPSIFPLKPAIKDVQIVIVHTSTKFLTTWSETSQAIQPLLTENSREKLWLFILLDVFMDALKSSNISLLRHPFPAFWIWLQVLLLIVLTGGWILDV